MKRTTILFLSAACLLAACTRTEESASPLPGELTLTVRVAAQHPEIAAALAGGQAMRVLLADPLAGAAEPAEQLRFTSRGGLWRGDPARLLGEGEATTLYALYPCCGEAENPRAITLDVAAQTDWLYTERGTEVDRDRNSVQITLEHLQAVLAFNIQRSGDYRGEGLARELRLEGAFPREATFDPVSRRLAIVSQGSCAIPCLRPVVEQGWRTEVPSLLSLPFRSSGSDVRIVLRVDDCEYACLLPEIRFYGGQRYLFHLALSDGRLALLADRTQITPIGETTADPEPLDFGLLRIGQEGIRFDAPLIGGGSPGTILWGDGEEQPYAPHAPHRYPDAGPHTVEVECWNADRAILDGLTGVTSIDFSSF